MEIYPMKWFRFYDEALNDPKVQKLPDAAFKSWVNLLCLANQGNPRGRINKEDVAYSLRISDERADKMIAYFKEKGLLEDEGQYLVPHAWDARQFASDNVTERTRKHRGNVPRNDSGNVAKPLQRTPPDTESEADTDTEADTEHPLTPSQGACVTFDDFWSLVINRNSGQKTARAAWDKAVERATPNEIMAGLMRHIPVWETFEDKSKIPHITTWLNQDRWTVENPIAPSTSRASPNGKPPSFQDEIAALRAKQQQPTPDSVHDTTWRMR